METAKGKYGNVPQYIQYTVMGQLQWRLLSDGDGSKATEVIGQKEYREYCELINILLESIDIEVVLSQRCMHIEQLFYAARISNSNGYNRKYNEEKKDIEYYFGDNYFSDAGRCFLKLEFMRIENGFLVLEGQCANLEDNTDTWVIINKEKYLLKKDNSFDLNVKILGNIGLYVDAFSVKVPLDKIVDDSIVFVSSIDGQEFERHNITLGKFMPITRQFSWSYYSGENWVIRLEDNKLHIWDVYNTKEFNDFERDFQNQIENSSVGQFPEIIEALDIRRAVIDRKSWNYGKLKKQIWLVSDRYSVADDNGEALFEYICKVNNPNIEVYFVIDSESPDFDRISKIGNVVAQDSREHLILHMLADVIISSQADEYIINPFWRKGVAGHVFRDMYASHKFVFLQHGVIKDDLSRWLNRYNKNIDGFVCSANKEAESILEYKYYYGKENVWLTGLPRYDRLYHDEKKKIIVMPTWRKWLMQDYNASISDKDATKVRENIETTEFGLFYKGLLNNKRLLDVCDQFGYTLCFMPHTNFRDCMDKFKEDERLELIGLDRKYRDAFAEAELLITDYSSTAMDFAYLRKPVVYVQFDKEEFFSGEHTYDKGYFEYEKDGFGEVVYDLESLINLVTEYIKNDCKLKEKYTERINGFFAFKDNGNCERVFNKIVEMK